EFTRKVFEQALANMRELAEMVSKSNTEAFAIINKRVTKSLLDLKTSVSLPHDSDSRPVSTPHGPGGGKGR
ncbi:MAG: TIGR01841 family phasin, partial [Candidatus Competibacteraceae bacterium]|nr:TIGR01841 family phasin [Candidatus Competibacteraceae bacterium]